MAYEKQTWIDHFVDDEGQIVQQGTAMDAEHFNHMEEGISNANDHADATNNPHNVTAEQLGFGIIIFYDEEGYLCMKDSNDD